jgi:aspartokinase
MSSLAKSLSNNFQTQLYDPSDLIEEVKVGTSVLDLLKRVPTKDRHSKQNRYDVNEGRTAGWSVHKFGGSTFADPSCYSFVANLVDSFDGKNLIVVSAMYGITNLLYSICAIAATGSHFKNSPEWATLYSRISGAIYERLGTSTAGMKEIQRLDADILYLNQILSMMCDSSPEDQELITRVVVGFGEIFSARLLTQVMREDFRRSAAFMDARDILVVNPRPEDSDAIDVCWDVTRTKLKNWWVNRKHCDVLVVTGFIARTLHGNLPTTLKRNGSDFSATIFFRPRESNFCHRMEGR